MKPLTRQSRHPLMVSQCIALAAISGWQVVAGPARHESLWHVPEGTYLQLALATLVGAVACMVAMVVLDAWTAAAFEMFGSLLLSCTAFVYLVSTWNNSTYPDTDIVTALLAGLLSGLVLRIVSLGRDVWAVSKDRKAPPVGDLDLLVSDEVDSVAALVVATHGPTPAAVMAEVEDMVPQTDPRHRAEDGP